MSVQAKQAVYSPQMPSFSFRPGRWLLGVVILLLVAFLYWAVQQLLNPMNAPVQKIQVQGSFVNVTEEMLAPLSKQVSGVGYFDVDVTAFQQKVEALPWVDQATIRRVWPDTLAIHFVEHHPTAVWASGGLLNERGELFKPSAATYPTGLPVFDGPEKSSARMLETYHRFSQMLLSLGMRIQQLKLDKRRSWQVVLQSGLHINLGREHEFERLARFVRVYPRIHAMDKGDLQRVDLRYTNGMAVTWKKNTA